MPSTQNDEITYNDREGAQLTSDTSELHRETSKYLYENNEAPNDESAISSQAIPKYLRKYHASRPWKRLEIFNAVLYDRERNESYKCGYLIVLTHNATIIQKPTKPVETNATTIEMGAIIAACLISSDRSNSLVLVNGMRCFGHFHPPHEQHHHNPS